MGSLYNAYPGLADVASVKRYERLNGQRSEKDKPKEPSEEQQHESKLNVPKKKQRRSDGDAFEGFCQNSGHGRLAGERVPHFRSQKAFLAFPVPTLRSFWKRSSLLSFGFPGCGLSSDRTELTSFTFTFDRVPEPVCHT